MKMKEFVFHFEFFLYVCFYYKQYLMIVLCLNFLFFFKQSHMIVYICLKQYLLVKSAYLNNYGIGNIILEIIYLFLYISYARF